MKTTNFTCENCKETFESGWSEEECRAEAIENGFNPDGDCGLVCDDCYHLIMKKCHGRPYANMIDN